MLKVQTLQDFVNLIKGELILGLDIAVVFVVLTNETVFDVLVGI